MFSLKRAVLVNVDLRVPCYSKCNMCLFAYVCYILNHVIFATNTTLSLSFHLYVYMYLFLQMKLRTGGCEWRNIKKQTSTSEKDWYWFISRQLLVWCSKRDTVKRAGKSMCKDGNRCQKSQSKDFALCGWRALLSNTDTHTGGPYTNDCGMNLMIFFH